MVEISLVNFDVSEVSEDKELAWVNDVPEIVKVLLHADLSHLAHLNHEKHGERNEAHYVAKLCNPVDLNYALDHDRADEGDHVEQEKPEEERGRLVELRVNNGLDGIKVVEAGVRLFLDHKLCQA